MSFYKNRGIKIAGLSCVVPQNRVTVESFSNVFGAEVSNKFSVGTGITAMYKALPEQTASDLATAAAESLFRRTAVDQNEIGLMVLVTLMLAASLIDIDERTIPDALTVLGTLFALASSVVLAPLLIDTPLTSTGLLGQPPVGQGTLRLLSSCSNEMQEFLRMALALFFWNGWCFAMMNRHWRPNHGWKLAWAIFWKRLGRTRSTRYYALLAMVGSGLILFLYRMAIFHSGNEAADAAWYYRWCNFQTALFGMGGAGAMLWAIRVAGFLGMKREALGFGDVTLVAMIGAFLGWRACVVLFLLSPFAALVVGILMVALRRGNEIPYGPFLCLAALVVILSEYSPWFELVSDWLCRVPVDLQLAFALAMFGLMVVLLRLIQWVKKLAGIEA